MFPLTQRQSQFMHKPPYSVPRKEVVLTLLSGIADTQVIPGIKTQSLERTCGFAEENAMV